MKKLIILATVVSFVGCSTICGFRADQREQVKQSLVMLQGGYDAVVEILKATPVPQVQIAVALTDAALDLTGALLDKWCPSQKEIDLALATAKQAERAKLRVLNK